MSKSTLKAAVDKIVSDLEAKMESARKFVDSQDAQLVGLALLGLMHGCHDLIDSLEAMAKGSPEAVADLATAGRMNDLRDALVASLPAISGGAPDDFECIDPAVFSDEWPAYLDADLDGYAWVPTFDGPTPLDVLALDDMEPEWTDADWDAYAALSLGVDEMDHHLVHGCV
ncbi:MAG: hypothetical protein BGO49_11505 [Planctomycetales bacterium 71-10]|nr:MAG: hypothetical protein BGO49_11505 [Planctomycetales bacterium 71-10]